nr:uncharacterized protein LOC114925989 [Arachis hypogaea]
MAFRHSAFSLTSRTVLGMSYVKSLVEKTFATSVIPSLATLIGYLELQEICSGEYRSGGIPLFLLGRRIKAPATRSSPPPSTRWTAVASFSIGVLHKSRSSLAQRSRSVVSSSSAVTSSSAHGRVHHFLFSPSSFVNLSESDQPSFFSIVFALGSSTDQDSVGKLEWLINKRLQLMQVGLKLGAFLLHLVSLDLHQKNQQGEEKQIPIQLQVMLLLWRQQHNLANQS